MNDLKDMDCAGRAQRRRRFGPREGRWFWWSARQVLRQSGVALRLPPQSKKSPITSGCTDSRVGMSGISGSDVPLALLPKVRDQKILGESVSRTTLMLRRLPLRLGGWRSAKQASLCATPLQSHHDFSQAQLRFALEPRAPCNQAERQAHALHRSKIWPSDRTVPDNPVLDFFRVCKLP